MAIRANRCASRRLLEWEVWLACAFLPSCSRIANIPPETVPVLSASSPAPRSVRVLTTDGETVTLDRDRLRYVKVQADSVADGEVVAFKPPFDAWLEGGQLVFRDSSAGTALTYPLDEVDQALVVQNDSSRVVLVATITVAATTLGVAGTWLAASAACSADQGTDCSQQRNLAAALGGSIALAISLPVSARLTRQLPTESPPDR